MTHENNKSKENTQLPSSAQPQPSQAFAQTDAVKRMLEAAIAEAKQRGHSVGKGRNSADRHSVTSAPTSTVTSHTPFREKNRDRASGAGIATQGRRKKYGWTGSGPDKWDPQPLTKLFAESANRPGWREEIFRGRIIKAWPDIVGENIATHCRVDKLDNGVLYIQTSTTSWATQLAMLQRDILKKIGKEFGPTVKRLQISGPQGPSWRKGPRHVPGRGPRDTYG